MNKWRAGPSANVPISVKVQRPPLQFFVPHLELVLDKTPMWDHCLCLGMGLYNILSQGERLLVIMVWLPAVSSAYESGKGSRIPDSVASRPFLSVNTRLGDCSSQQWPALATPATKPAPGSALVVLKELQNGRNSDGPVQGETIEPIGVLSSAARFAK